MVSENNLTRIQTSGRSTNVFTIEYEPHPLKNAGKLIFFACLPFPIWRSGKVSDLKHFWFSLEK